MEQPIKIAVLGGGGRTGSFVVQDLIEKGYLVKLLLRSRERAASRVSLDHPSIEILEGDAVQFDDVRQLLSGCSGVINALGQRDGEPLVASQATSHVLKVIAEDPALAEIRYVVMAGITVDAPSDRKGVAASQATEWMKSNYGWIYDDRQEFYRILAESEANWTLVRVPFIEFEGKSGLLEADLYDTPSMRIDAVDIASFMVNQLKDDTFLRKAPFIGDVSTAA